MSRIAFLGLGRMGAPMAAALAAAGHDLVVWNRSPAGYELLARECGDFPPPPAAATPGEAATGVRLVVTMLADAHALDDVLFGSDGVLTGAAPGTVVCDMSTIGVEAALSIHARLGEHQIEFVDAPVSGSVPTVRAHGLLVMAGGSEEAVEKVREVFTAFARSVVRVGGPGSGQVVKLAVNSVVHSLNASLSEALVLAERGGVAGDTMFDVFVDSVVGAPFVSYKRAAFLDPDGQAVAFTIDLMRKDLDLIEAFAVSGDTAVPVASSAHRLADEASRAGLGEADMSAVAVHLRRSASR
jgi:3-hydroxyisobutyrate dehydrogenase-like beta-hydroxyacid dehydrogenase